MKKKVLTLLPAIALATGFFSLAYAESDYLSAFRARYGSGITIDNCGLCHPGGSTSRLNQFALDFADPSIGDHSFGTAGQPNTVLDNRDSDGDGITNINEINARTYPGSITLQFSAATYSANENGGSVTITVTRTGGGDSSVGVSYATSNGTATAASDYTSSSGTLSWTGADTSNKTFSIPILDDSVSEGNETVNLTLSSPTGGATLGSPSTVVLTITDNDAAPAGNLQFSAATYSVNENGGSMTITVTRTGGSNGAVGVSYATSNGTATSGSDYTAASGTLNWTNGDTSNKTFSVSILNDSTYESNETVNLTLSSPTGGATLGSPSSAVLTIISDRRLLVDFDGDRKTDIAFYRSSTGVWWITPSSGTPAYNYSWGGDASDIPVAGDYDGDGKTDIAIYDTTGGTWSVIPSSTGVAYGVGHGGDPNDKVVPADYDGDGKTDIAIYRSHWGAWYIIPSSTGVLYGVGWGGDPNDKPVPADYDGDGKTDVAIYRSHWGAWYIIPSSTGVSYGVGLGGDVTNDKLVPGDYDGDGKTDIAIYRSHWGAWYIIPSSTGVLYGVGWGGDPNDKPVPGDYDGDGKADIAIYRSHWGAWYIIPSSTGVPYGVGWGGDPSDVPLTANPN